MIRLALFVVLCVGLYYLFALLGGASAIGYIVAHFGVPSPVAWGVVLAGVGLIGMTVAKG